MLLAVEIEAGLALADAAAAEQELMLTLNHMLTSNKQNIAARKVFHLAMESLEGELGA